MSSLHTTQISQVEIRDRPVSWRFCRQDYGPTRVFYDELHQEIVLVTAQFVCKSHRASSKMNRFSMRIPNHHQLLQVKFSPNNQFIGLQIGPSELVCNAFHNVPCLFTFCFVSFFHVFLKYPCAVFCNCKESRLPQKLLTNFFKSCL